MNNYRNRNNVRMAVDNFNIHSGYRGGLLILYAETNIREIPALSGPLFYRFHWRRAGIGSLTLWRAEKSSGIAISNKVVLSLTHLASSSGVLLLD